MKKAIGIFCVLTMAAVSFAGCSSSGGKSGSSGKTTITLMQSKTESQNNLQKVVDDYNSTQSGVTVQLLGTTGDNYATVLQSQFSATPEKAPTIFTSGGTDTKKFQPFMAPLDGSKAASMLLSQFKSEVSSGGKVYGLPMAVEGYGLIYNKDLFQKAGVDASQLTSIDALVSASQKLAGVSGVSHPIAFAKENYFVFIHPFNWAFAVDDGYANDIQQINSGKKTMADIPSVSQWAKDMDQLKPYTNKALDSYDDQVSGFAAGKFAMIHQGDWAQSVLDQDKVSFDYGLIPFPTGGNQKLAVDISTSWRINKYANSAQQKAAVAFLDWLMTSDKGQSYCADTFQFISALKGVKEPSGKLAQLVSGYVQSNKTIPWVYNTDFPNGIDADGASLMQQYYAGNISSSQLLTGITRAWVQDAQK